MATRLGKWNVPGNGYYDGEIGPDFAMRSLVDQEVRGYWLARDLNRQLYFVSNQNHADYVWGDQDPDGVQVIVYDTTLTQDLDFEIGVDEIGVISVELYS